jgi:hypothetical protein
MENKRSASHTFAYCIAYPRIHAASPPPPPNAEDEIVVHYAARHVGRPPGLRNQCNFPALWARSYAIWQTVGVAWERTTKQNKLRGLYSASELYRRSDRYLLANLVPNFADRVVSRGQRGRSPTVVNRSFLDRSCYFSFK